MYKLFETRNLESCKCTRYLPFMPYYKILNRSKFYRWIQSFQRNFDGICDLINTLTLNTFNGTVMY